MGERSLREAQTRPLTMAGAETKETTAAPLPLTMETRLPMTREEKTHLPLLPAAASLTLPPFLPFSALL